MIRFEPDKNFDYEPGQFLSVFVPPVFGNPQQAKTVRRAYSLASSGKKQGYELCIRHSPPYGRGSSYFASLKVGSEFAITAPYGDFGLQTDSSRRLCMIATSTGLAPFRSIAMSEQFKSSPPLQATLIFGAQNEAEILYPGAFEWVGFKTVHCLTKPSGEWQGFRGRVTDYLRSLSSNYPFHGTDFYICGNGQMISDVERILREERGVSEKSIFFESYSPPIASENRRKAA